MVAGGSMHGCWGACVVAGGAWLLGGGMHGCRGCVVVGGACMAAGRGACIVYDEIQVNERALRILLECILVLHKCFWWYMVALIAVAVRPLIAA